MYTFLFAKNTYFVLDKENGCPLPPYKAYPGDAGWDLFTSREVVIEPHSFGEMHTDLKISLPVGYWAMITSRSSVLKEHSIQIGNAIIDNGYRGEMLVIAYNLTEEHITIPVHTRLAQLILMPLVYTYWEQVSEDQLPEGDRGEEGFGSTGRLLPPPMEELV